MIERILLVLVMLAAASPAGAQPRSFLYQLQGLSVAEVATSPFDLVVTDYSLDGSASGELSQADVSALRAGGTRTVLAYLSIGEAEDYRFYWQPNWKSSPPAWLGPTNPDWPGNYKVRYWDPAWQAVIFGSATAYLDQIIEQGFDGVYLDVVDAFEYWGPDGNNVRPTAAQDMVDFVKTLATYARVVKDKPAFQVFPQNGAQLALVDPSYVTTVTGIGAEDTWTVGNGSQRRYHTDHVTAWLDLFREAGKTVLAIDYPTLRARIDDFYSLAEARGYLPYATTRQLDQYRVQPGHPPAPGGPAVTLVAPPDGMDVRAATPPTFSWTGTDGAADYQILFAGYDSFRQLTRFPSRSKFTTATTFTPSVAEWKRIAALAGKNGYGSVYWWVMARDAAGALRSARARRLIQLHEQISTTTFWIGEAASLENGFIANDDSAWDECWKENYGGIDDPDNRSGHLPAAFVPNENPFYVALPYNDFDAAGMRRETVADVVPWAKTTTFSPTDSAVKNRWVKIIYGGQTCYGQWEDVGPFREDDIRYVFGRSRPRNRTNNRAGLDVSPAVRDCLGLIDGIVPTSWRFVEAGDVPPGPWSSTVTTSQLNHDPSTCP